MNLKTCLMVVMVLAFICLAVTYAMPASVEAAEWDMDALADVEQEYKRGRCGPPQAPQWC